MTDTISLTGVVGTTPKSLQTQTGLWIASFRLASSQRRFDRQKNEWVESDPNWYTVNAFRQLADNVSVSLSKGDRVVVTGRLRIRAWESGDRTGTTVEIDAESVGHDLFWGTTTLTRISPAGGSARSDAVPQESRVAASAALAPAGGASSPGVAPGGGAASAGGAAASWGVGLVPVSPGSGVAEAVGAAGAAGAVGATGDVGALAASGAALVGAVSIGGAAAESAGADTVAPDLVTAGSGPGARERWHGDDAEAPF
ncbi:Single-stranded DNA-binding protein [Frondihabitans sp. 762G35]|uniref:single-stranded DNA-binding protein n=1 Tax=Frondihabitans sp. 762G35 TaxID=1446794 RepID=UPI000D20FB80|nr:single-stranded DNA-binding protein [Frondihabitans sp. 762G35]ARC56428.1 Single-stranded DNA-binding protein [Frondihabitans sp. 762G35]